LGCHFVRLPKLKPSVTGNFQRGTIHKATREVGIEVRKAIENRVAEIQKPSLLSPRIKSHWLTKTDVKKKHSEEAKKHNKGPIVYCTKTRCSRNHDNPNQGLEKRLAQRKFLSSWALIREPMRYGLQECLNGRP